jgi:hypothetical protein
MAVEFIKKAAQLGILQQSKTSNHWIAPQTAASNFITHPVDEGSVSPDFGVTIDELMFQGSNTLMKEYDRKYIDGISGLKYLTYKYSSVPVQHLAAYLVAFFQKCTEGATTPFAKDISPVNTDVDFAGNNGFLYGIGYSPSGFALTDLMILDNALLDTLKFSIDNLANGIKRVVGLDCKWVGNALTPDLTKSGTWVAAPTSTATFLNNKTLGFTLNLVVGATTLNAICYRKFEFDGANGVSVPCATIGGKANNYRLNPTIKFNIDIPYNTNTKAIVGSFKAGDNVSFDFGNGSGTDSGTILFTVANAHLTANPLEIQDNYHALRLQVEATKPTAGFSTSFIKYADSVDGGY